MQKKQTSLSADHFSSQWLASGKTLHVLSQEFSHQFFT